MAADVIVGMDMRILVDINWSIVFIPGSTTIQVCISSMCSPVGRPAEESFKVVIVHDVFVHGW